MKKNILSLTVIVFMAGVVLTSCGQASKQDAKTVKEDVKELNKDLKQGAKDSSEEIKSSVTSEWNKFENASNTAIEKTENKIQELRAKIAKVNENEKEKWTKELDKLEQKNKELKEKLAKRGQAFKDDVISFNASTVANEQKFEREFNHDITELGSALKDLFKNNVN
ncbi:MULTISPECIES: hypothetical protein [unclassified Lacinutrix]